jgi:hypothetical protein
LRNFSLLHFCPIERETSTLFKLLQEKFNGSPIKNLTAHQFGIFPPQAGPTEKGELPAI